MLFLALRVCLRCFSIAHSRSRRNAEYQNVI
jgi:hypothetical protein